MEAAFVIPALALLLLLLLQPAIVLYDRAVMGAAAAEGCRLLQTAPADIAQNALQGYVERRLGAIPQTDIFHVHAPCTYEIDGQGAEGSEYVSVRIANKLRPLPIAGSALALFGGLDGDGLFTVEVEARVRARAGWVQGSPGSWIGAWK